MFILKKKIHYSTKNYIIFYAPKKLKNTFSRKKTTPFPLKKLYNLFGKQLFFFQNEHHENEIYPSVCERITRDFYSIIEIFIFYKLPIIKHGVQRCPHWRYRAKTMCALKTSARPSLSARPRPDCRLYQLYIVMRCYIISFKIIFILRKGLFYLQYSAFVINLSLE